MSAPKPNAKRAAPIERTVERSDEHLVTKKRGRKARHSTDRDTADAGRTVSSAAATTSHDSSSSSSSSISRSQADSGTAQVSTTSSQCQCAAPVFIKKLKRFWLNGRDSASEGSQLRSLCASSAPESPAVASVAAHSTADQLVLNPPDSVALSDLSISNLPSLSSPSVMHAMANELPFDAPVSNSNFSPPASRGDQQHHRPVGQQPAARVSLTQLQPLASGSPLSMSLCPSCRQTKPTTPCTTCVGASDNALAIPEVLVSTTIREPSDEQRSAGTDSVVVVESRRALASGVNLLLPDSNSVSSVVKTSVGLIPDAQFDQIFSTITECIRLITAPFNDEEAAAIREGLQSTSLHALTGMLFCDLFCNRRIVNNVENI